MKPPRGMFWGLLFLAGFTVMGGVSLSVLDQPGQVSGLDSTNVADQMFSGTIKGIDQVGLRMVIQTKKGMLFIQAADADAIRGLTPGDHVTVKMDEQGYILAITKNANSPKLIV